MTSTITPSSFALVPSLETAWQDVDSSFERFCLTAGIGALEQMLCEDAQRLAGAGARPDFRHERHAAPPGCFRPEDGETKSLSYTKYLDFVSGCG